VKKSEKQGKVHQNALPVYNDSYKVSTSLSTMNTVTFQHNNTEKFTVQNHKSTNSRSIFLDKWLEYEYLRK